MISKNTTKPYTHSIKGADDGRQGLLNLAWARVLVAAVYAVGIVGMAIPATRPIFQMMTPIHLLFSLGMLFLFHRGWAKQFWVFMLLAFGIGFGAEVLGVHTGFPFGDYRYGPVLGIQMLEVPLMIGVNWLLLVYLTGHFILNKITHDYLAAAAGALLMVVIDLLIEPVAIALDFWAWENGAIPPQNYLGWFVVAFGILVLYRKMAFHKTNALSNFQLLNLMAFFAILNFIL